MELPFTDVDWPGTQMSGNISKLQPVPAEIYPLQPKQQVERVISDRRPKNVVEGSSNAGPLLSMPRGLSDSLTALQGSAPDLSQAYT